MPCVTVALIENLQHVYLQPALFVLLSGFGRHVTPERCGMKWRLHTDAVFSVESL